MEAVHRSLPFTFAQQYGVLLQQADPLLVLHRAPLPVGYYSKYPS